jgi:hypothetical protein
MLIQVQSTKVHEHQLGLYQQSSGWEAQREEGEKKRRDMKDCKPVLRMEWKIIMERDTDVRHQAQATATLYEHPTPRSAIRASGRPAPSARAGRGSLGLLARASISCARRDGAEHALGRRTARALRPCWRRPRSSRMRDVKPDAWAYEHARRQRRRIICAREPERAGARAGRECLRIARSARDEAPAGRTDAFVRSVGFCGGKAQAARALDRAAGVRFGDGVLRVLRLLVAAGKTDERARVPNDVRPEIAAADAAEGCGEREGRCVRPGRSAEGCLSGWRGEESVNTDLMRPHFRVQYHGACAVVDAAAGEVCTEEDAGAGCGVCETGWSGC